MADNTYNFKNAETLKNKNGDSLAFATFNANVTITLFQKGQNRPAMNINLTRYLSILFGKALKKIREGSPGDKQSIMTQMWDSNEKKYSATSAVIVFSKDDSGVIHLEVSNPNVNPAARFTLTAPGGISVNSNPMTAEQRSALGAESLYHYITQDVPMQRSLIRLNYVPQAFNSGGNKPQQQSQSSSGGSESSIFD